MDCFSIAVFVWLGRLALVLVPARTTVGLGPSLIFDSVWLAVLFEGLIFNRCVRLAGRPLSCSRSRLVRRRPSAKASEAPFF